ncbi:MAG: AI-2E family transporter, partial [Planctomycetes bacterium]|nr:AI-2E family transporter [Planctomycetota bacterium]
MGTVADWFNRHRRLLGAAVLLALVSLAVWRIRGVLLPFVLAIVLSYLFNPLVKLLVKKGFSRTAALVFIYVVFFLTVAVGVGLVIPTVVFELNRLAEFVPQYFAQVQEMAYEFQARYSEVQLPQAVRQAIDDAVLTVQGKLLGLVSSAAQSILGVFSAFFSLIVAPVLSFYLLRDVDGLRAGLGRFIPSRDRRGTLKLLSEIDGVVAGFVRGQLIVASIVGSLVTLALFLLNIRFAVILGIVAGVAEVIPYFGPFIGAIPALAVAASTSTLTAIKVLVALTAIQQLE